MSAAEGDWGSVGINLMQVGTQDRRIQIGSTTTSTAGATTTTMGEGTVVYTDTNSPYKFRVDRSAPPNLRRWDVWTRVLGVGSNLEFARDSPRYYDMNAERHQVIDDISRKTGIPIYDLFVESDHALI